LLYVLNNWIVTFRNKGLGEVLPNLETLILTNNRIHDLADLDPLAEMKKLRYLSLLGNPVTKKPHYRLYVIHKLPNLRLLDFSKVKAKVCLSNNSSLYSALICELSFVFLVSHLLTISLFLCLGTTSSRTTFWWRCRKKTSSSFFPSHSLTLTHSHSLTLSRLLSLSFSFSFSFIPLFHILSTSYCFSKLFFFSINNCLKKNEMQISLTKEHVVNIVC
jgi:hypothetical protein